MGTNPLSLAHTTSLALGHRHRLAHRVKMANLLSLPETSFNELVQQVEKDPLFLHYKNHPDQNDRLFGFQRFPRSGVSTHFLEINENTAPAQNNSTLADQYLDDKKEIIALCNKIGMEHFKEYFLYNDGAHSPEEISAACDLSLEGTKKIVQLVDHLALDEEFQQNNTLAQSNGHQHYNKIAQIQQDNEGEFIVNYTSLRYARGRYVIDYEKYEHLKNASQFSKEEIAYLQNMIKTMEMINTRKSIIYQTLEKITERQKPFLLSRDPGRLNALTQLELGREIDVHSSSICRAICGKSIGMPWGEEIPIKFFFVRGPVHKIKAAMYMLVADEEKRFKAGTLQAPYRDDEIKGLLLVEHKMKIAVRTVAKYRAELGISNVYERATSYLTSREKSPSLN